MSSRTGAVAQIRAALGTLVASERRVAEVVLSDPQAIVRMTASQLGAAADTSAMTVVRFARNVGFSGFQELAISLAMADPAVTPAASLELTTSDSPAEILASVSAIAGRAAAACAATIDPDALRDALEAIAGARHVLCLGAGLSLSVANDLAVRLNHLGISADAPADRQVQRVRAMHLRPDEVCFTILQGGTYPPIVDAAKDAARAGAHVIALTPFDGTPLTETARTPLLTGADEIHALVDAWPVRIQFMVVIDALIVALMNSDRTKYSRPLQDISDLIEQDNI